MKRNNKKIIRKDNVYFVHSQYHVNVTGENLKSNCVLFCSSVWTKDRQRIELSFPESLKLSFGHVTQSYKVFF